MAQSQQAPKQPRELNNANAGSNILHLSPTLDVDADDIIGTAIAAFGMPGSGKTSFAVMLLEQFSQHYIPIADFDVEGDHLSATTVFPRGVRASIDNFPSGRDILDYGLQVVYDLSSWGSKTNQASLIVSIIQDMITWASERPSHERVPSIIALDEAQHWLPQKATTLESEKQTALTKTFSDLASRGRKRGLTPALFAPRISEVNKDCLLPGFYALMKQTGDTDLKRYMDYISTGDLTEKQVKARIAAFGRGRAIVKLPRGGQKIVTFHDRVSEHTSHTPKTQAAINRYASLGPVPAIFAAHPVKPEQAAPSAPAQTVQPKPAKEPVALTRKPAQDAKAGPKPARTTRKKVFAALKQDSSQMPATLAERFKCTPETASNYRSQFFKAFPDRR